MSPYFTMPHFFLVRSPDNAQIYATDSEAMAHAEMRDTSEHVYMCWPDECRMTDVTASMADDWAAANLTWETFESDVPAAYRPYLSEQIEQAEWEREQREESPDEARGDYMNHMFDFA